MYSSYYSFAAHTHNTTIGPPWTHGSPTRWLVDTQNHELDFVTTIKLDKDQTWPQYFPIVAGLFHRWKVGSFALLIDVHGCPADRIRAIGVCWRQNDIINVPKGVQTQEKLYHDKPNVVWRCLVARIDVPFGPGFIHFCSFQWSGAT